MKLEGLQPEKVFYWFEKLCAIPHGSGNTKMISDYLVNFAREQGLRYIQDENNNVILFGEGTCGMEDHPPVILQGHMDMVTVKKVDCEIDLEKEPLKLKIDGDFIYAEGTSLGGDDGIAVAYILAIMDSDDIAHPRIEAVITTDEEIGMEGATAIDLSMLKAKRMMNIDSEEEGILLASCAGGARIDCNIPIVREEKAGIFYKIKVGGLLGGHSGVEINKERGNAIKMLGRVLYMISKEMPIQIADLSGGEKDNAIPREAEAVVLVENTQEKRFVEFVKKIEEILKNEYNTKEKELYLISVRLGNQNKRILKQESTKRVIDFLMVLPNGIMAMSIDIAGLVETSLNVGILKLEENEMIASSAIRSSIESAKKYIMEQMEVVSSLAGGSISVHGDYPGWQYDPDSKLRATMLQVYDEMFGIKPKVEAIHAGLECGVFADAIDGIDCISIGPALFDVHTVNEKLSILEIDCYSLPLMLYFC